MSTRRCSLPEEIVVWEILARLPPKSLLRCRSVCRAWRRATSARDFLLAHHARQPSLPIFSDNDFQYHYHKILAFNSRAGTKDDQLHAVAQLDEAFHPEASCDGLLVLSKLGSSRSCLSICNPATREHALLGPPWDFGIMGMYRHHPTSEYRLLLQRRRRKVAADSSPKDPIGCYVFALGSDQPPRYIGWQEMASGTFCLPVRVRDSLHWYPAYYQIGSNPYRSEWENKLTVFDTVAESFWYMREPIVPGNSYAFDMNGMLGIYTHNHSTEVIDIRVLQNYESEVWELKCRIQLPVAEIKRKFVGCDSDVEGRDYNWDLDVVSVDSGVLLLVMFSQWLLHLDSDGKLVNSFYRGRNMSISGYLLKQSLVRHTFFSALEGYTVNASPFI